MRQYYDNYKREQCKKVMCKLITEEMLPFTHSDLNISSKCNTWGKLDRLMICVILNNIVLSILIPHAEVSVSLCLESSVIDLFGT